MPRRRDCLKRLALARELHMIVTRLHGPGLVTVDYVKGAVLWGDQEVLRLERKNDPRTKKRRMVFITSAEEPLVARAEPSIKMLYTLIHELKRRARVQQVDLDGVAFVCTSKL